MIWTPKNRVAYKKFLIWQTNQHFFYLFLVISVRFFNYLLFYVAQIYIFCMLSPEIIQHNFSCQNHNRCLIVWSALNLPYINGILIVQVVWLCGLVFGDVFSMCRHIKYKWMKIKPRQREKKRQKLYFVRDDCITCILDLDWQYKLCYVDDIINYNMNWFLIFVLLLSSSNTNYCMWTFSYMRRTPYFHFLLLAVFFCLNLSLIDANIERVKKAANEKRASEGERYTDRKEEESKKIGNVFRSLWCH